MYIKSITNQYTDKGKQYQFAVVKCNFNRVLRRQNYSSYEHTLTFTCGTITDFNENYVYTTAGFNYHPNYIFDWKELVPYFAKVHYTRPAKYDPKWLYRYICV